MPSKASTPSPCGEPAGTRQQQLASLKLDVVSWSLLPLAFPKGSRKNEPIHPPPFPGNYTSVALGSLSLPTRLAKLSIHRPHPDLTLWYDKPAAQWIDALPVGNGRLGAMVFGGGDDGAPQKELLQFNEDTLWSGQPRRQQPRRQKSPCRIRAAVLEQQDYHLADQLCHKMQGLFAEAYQPSWQSPPRAHSLRPINKTIAANLISTPPSPLRPTQSPASNSTRSLRLRSGPGIILHVSAGKPGQLNATLTLDSPLQNPSPSFPTIASNLPAKLQLTSPVQAIPTVNNPLPSPTCPAKACTSPPSSNSNSKTAPPPQTPLASRSPTQPPSPSSSPLRPDFVASKPNLTSPSTSIVAAAKHQLDTASTKSFTTLRPTTSPTTRRLFRRVSLNLGTANTRKANRPAPERLRRPPDPSLLALYFQYGRYLLISSSRPGSQPANLQGIWNYQVTPPWSSNWTANINIQMNYWPAETTNLTDAPALFDLIDGLSQTGAVTAKENYGLPGWCSHHNIDIWRAANPVGEGVGSPTWANWGMSGPWLCAHLYEHYLFTRDSDFLRNRAYPLMKGAAEFSSHGSSKTAKAASPPAPPSPPRTTSSPPTENPPSPAPAAPWTWPSSANSSPTASPPPKNSPRPRLRDKTHAAIPRLIPYQIGKYGQLQEWSIDFEEATPGQRHMSHMYPLYPGNQITPRQNSRTGTSRPCLARTPSRQRRRLHRMEPRLGYRLLDPSPRRRQSMGVPLHAHAAQHQHQSLRHPPFRQNLDLPDRRKLRHNRRHRRTSPPKPRRANRSPARASNRVVRRLRQRSSRKRRPRVDPPGRKQTQRLRHPPHVTGEQILRPPKAKRSPPSNRYKIHRLSPPNPAEPTALELEAGETYSHYLLVTLRGEESKSSAPAARPAPPEPAADSAPAYSNAAHPPSPPRSPPPSSHPPTASYPHCEYSSHRPQ